ncbi:MAG: hypothetical protein AAFQ04_03670 [Pseudomonadota bacterium]
MTDTFTITRPEDLHMHQREEGLSRAGLPETNQHFARAFVMENLVPPVVSGANARVCRDSSLATLPGAMSFTPLTMFNLPEDTDPEGVAAAHAQGLIHAVELYPAGATTTSSSGARDMAQMRPMLERMAEIGRNHLLLEGTRPHNDRLPLAKREEHRLALRKAATSGEAFFFLGTDSTCDTNLNKDMACGCVGCFTATNTMSILVEIFEQEDTLDRLECFTSLNGPAFYRRPANEDKIILTRGEPVAYSEKLHSDEGPVALFDPQMPPRWRVN